ncbi:Transcription factor spt8 [Didymella heteroderae]|uniref:Transcription factor spt8 n=1 Tax=Didymella heteroderae TaxID=1769908 RepID=A0A9P4WLM5_9PLEO|nr:Transcription factor spt8 [Didymella heteroderae]
MTRVASANVGASLTARLERLHIDGSRCAQAFRASMNEDDYDDNGASSAEEEDEQEENDAMDVDEDEGGDEDEDADNDDDDAEGDNDDDDDPDGEGDGDGDGDGDEDQDEAGSPSQRRGLANGDVTNPRVTRTSPSPQAGAAAGSLGNLPFRPSVRQEALSAPVYDIIPTIAAPHSTSINAITATPDMRWVFSGGADGYIRKFNWIDTANGKLALTVAQRHPFVDSVTKAGVLLSYWENEDPAADAPSPVYSLAVHHQALWLLSGTEAGGINLQSVRHQEGHRITTMKGHTSAVSVLTLAADETSVLSGSWDKTINDWDLHTGSVKRRFVTSDSQISAIEQRPTSALPVPQEADTQPLANGTFTSNNAARPRANGTSGTNGTNGLDPVARTAAKDEPASEDAPGSPDDSLFGDGGDKDSLFGDGADNNPSAALPGMGDDDDDDEFSRAIANGIQAAEDDHNGDMDMMDMGGPVQAPDAQTATQTATETQSTQDEAAKSPPAAAETQDPAPQTNGLPHADEVPTVVKETPSLPPSSESTFLSSSIDGMLAIWDRRQPSPVARISPPRGTPPWCMNACWSPDGNFIYAGRRNGTVDEYSLHKTLLEPSRSFKFPGVSGPVSAVRAMPNGRTLICASYDILRQYDLSHTTASATGTSTSTNTAATPFLIVPGHRTGVISQLYLDPTCTFMISTGGNRGWEGATTEVLLGYEISYGA